MKRILSWIIGMAVIAAISVAITIYVIDTSETPDSYDVHFIDSKILSEKREIIISKPEHYDDNDLRDLPVIYVFGGNSLTYSISYDVQLLMRTGYLEPVIVVGVSNINQKTRQRDLTPPFMKQDIDESNSPLGKADTYLEFIESEVIPLIEKEYRTSSERIAVGHSREGLLVMYSQISRPNLFIGRLALSPALWREENLFVDKFKDYLQKQNSIESKLFLSIGDQEVEKMKKAFDLTIDFLAKDSTVMDWKSQYTKGAVHSNNAILSAPIGIDWIFKN